MKHIENVMHGVKSSSTESHKSFPIQYGVWGEKFLKCIAINSLPTNNNEIYILHSDVQNTFICFVCRISQNISGTL